MHVSRHVAFDVSSQNPLRNLARAKQANIIKYHETHFTSSRFCSLAPLYKLKRNEVGEVRALCSTGYETKHTARISGHAPLDGRVGTPMLTELPRPPPARGESFEGLVNVAFDDL